jgi:hypothetical protein
VVLSPTPDERLGPGHPAYFDLTVLHPQIGGDFPTDTRVKDDPRLRKEGTPATRGIFELVGLNRKPTFYYYGDDYSVRTREEFRATAVHEIQHHADRHQERGAEPSHFGVWQRYQTEFRAYWIEPELPEPPANPSGSIFVPNPNRPRPGHFASEKTPAENREAIQAKNPTATCTWRAPRFKNLRQEQIFRYMMKEGYLFVDLYVCDNDFFKKVNDFDRPESLNLIDSTRLDRLGDAIEKCTPQMGPNAPAVRELFRVVGLLDALDRAFLRDKSLSVRVWTFAQHRLSPSLFAQISPLMT